MQRNTPNPPLPLHSQISSTNLCIAYEGRLSHSSHFVVQTTAGCTLQISCWKGSMITWHYAGQAGFPTGCRSNAPLHFQVPSLGRPLLDLEVNVEFGLVSVALLAPHAHGLEQAQSENFFQALLRHILMVDVSLLQQVAPAPLSAQQGIFQLFSLDLCHKA